MTEEFLNRFSSELRRKLPGFEAQKHMAPLSRKSQTEYKINAQTRISGVLILMYPFQNQLQTVFILRPEYDGVHSGQIAFPGGKREEYDYSIEHTALREAEEEVGVIKDHVKVLGRLSKLYIPPSNALVTPVLGYTDQKPTFIPDPKEVAEILEAPIAHFLDERNKGKVDMNIRGGMLKGVPYYDLHGHRVWGATAMIISEFTEIYKTL